jgi:H+-transporting ATPase
MPTTDDRATDVAPKAERAGDGSDGPSPMPHADGLTTAEAEERLARLGPNAIEEKRPSALLMLAHYFWGPIPWMIEVAALLSAVIGHWADLAIILVLLMFNAAVGFWQEHQAANAVAALKKQLALRARVRRDGRWVEIAADQLVPDDLIRLRLGDIVPADATLVEGAYLTVDQSALTGESLPVDKKTGEPAYSGSIVRQGEMTAVVTETGPRTYFGRTASLVSRAKPVSHFQRAVLTIGNYLIYLSIGLAMILLLVEILRGAQPLVLIQFALILTVAAIPVAMPAVLSVTMAVGALALSRMKAIVSRLDAVEELAGMDWLCTDKTGTLTQNRLAVGEPALFSAASSQELILAAALASRSENGDTIDAAVLAAQDDASALARYSQVDFVPFDPVRKRTEATVQSVDGQRFEVTKGAPQVILDLCRPDDDLGARASGVVDDFAARGYRALGVARRNSSDQTWSFLGILPLSDPPREDSAETIRDARSHGIRVQMVTGDNVAIAREISTQLGLGADVRTAGGLLEGIDPDQFVPPETARRIEESDAFAEVFPEHKFEIVRALQSRHHIVGMTGDGVNDAPALKQADTGIAVSGATDAARAAASLVLTAPGLSVIVHAIEEGRRIFERMNSYAIYRITETIRVMLFVVLAMIALNFYPITPILIILLALFNDVPIMAIAVDNTWLDPEPVRWDMRRVLTVATALGAVGVFSSFVLVIAVAGFAHLDMPQVQTFVFLKMAVAGHLTLFVARTRGPLYSRPFPAPTLLWTTILTKLAATLLAVYGLGLVTPISWPQAILIWVYALVWMVILDQVKLAVYGRLEARQGEPKQPLPALAVVSPDPPLRPGVAARTPAEEADHAG